MCLHYVPSCKDWKLNVVYTWPEITDIFISQVSRYHEHPRITMAAQCRPMFIIRRAEYFQYSMLYITLGIFVEVGSTSSGSIVTH